MTMQTTKDSLLWEAKHFGHAEARTKAKQAAAQALVKEGKFKLGGNSSAGWQWYQLPAVAP